MKLNEKKIVILLNWVSKPLYGFLLALHVSIVCCISMCALSTVSPLFHSSLKCVVTVAEHITSTNSIYATRKLLFFSCCRCWVAFVTLFVSFRFFSLHLFHFSLLLYYAVRWHWLDGVNNFLFLYTCNFRYRLFIPQKWNAPTIPMSLLLYVRCSW